jgi:DNA-directed RNA polymerase specialized sigma24 family protein
MPDNNRPGRPAPRAGDHQPGPPAAQAAAEPGGCTLSPLDSADAAFRALTTGPKPLALHAAALAPGLPDRLVPLDELRVLLLHPATGARARNKVWAELVRRARSGSPAWVVGLVGVAMPGLRRAAATLSATYRGDAADLQTEILTGFLAAMRALDPGDLDQIPLASRLCWAAWRAGQALAYADARYTAARRDLSDSSDAPYMPWGHPDFVLAAAVARGILTPAQAELIGRNRLEGIPLAQIAGELGISHSALCNRRKRAEKAITDAIRGGLLSDS